MATRLERSLTTGQDGSAIATIHGANAVASRT